MRDWDKVGTRAEPVRRDDAALFGTRYVFGEGDARLPCPREPQALGADDVVTMTKAAVWELAHATFPKVANRPGSTGYSDEKRMPVLRDWVRTTNSLRQIAKDHHMAPATVVRMTKGIARPPKEKDE